MGVGTSIEWTTATWNPLTGCTKISPGCTHCYAERMSNRLRLMGQPNYVNGFDLTLHERMLDQPLRWKKPQSVFVNSMSDLFHKDVPVDFIRRVFDVMQEAHWHQFQVLTKRADRLEEVSPLLPWPDNVWQGVSVEDADYTFRIDHLRRTGARTKFLSIEPLLGPLPNPLLGPLLPRAGGGPGRGGGARSCGGLPLPARDLGELALQGRRLGLQPVQPLPLGRLARLDGRHLAALVADQLLDPRLGHGGLLA